MKRIYLDYAATTPVDPRVAKAMRDFEIQYFGNPNSIHREGQQARAEIDFARASIAKFINARPQEIIFTSGATEANNLAIQGIVKCGGPSSTFKPHIVTTALEHQSVYNVVKELESRGVIEATFVKPKKDGTISAEKIISAIKKNTILVSVIFVSNEIGSVLPVREIGLAIRYQISDIRYHIDAVQAAQFYNLNVEKLGCDLLTLSAHKIYGPKGIGALYVKKGSKLKNLLYGGSQEYGLRPGTQSTSGIIGFAKAVELLGSLEERQVAAEKIKKLRDKLLEFVQTLPNVEINGPTGESRVANNISFIVFGADQDALMTVLDLAGIAASTGSACTSGSVEPSHVIQSLRKIAKQKAATIRLSLGRKTTVSEINATIRILKRIV